MSSHPGRNARPSTVLPAKNQLSQGAIELIGVAPHPSGNQSWWKADGTPATDRTRDLPAGASLPAWQFKPGANWAGGGAPAHASEPGKNLDGHHLIAASLPRKSRTVTIKAGVAVGAWDTIVTSDSRGGLSTAVVKEGMNWNISFGDPVETK